jgi:hypothetical protein
VPRQIIRSCILSEQLLPARACCKSEGSQLLVGAVSSLSNGCICAQIGETQQCTASICDGVAPQLFSLAGAAAHFLVAAAGAASPVATPVAADATQMNIDPPAWIAHVLRSSLSAEEKAAARAFLEDHVDKCAQLTVYAQKQLRTPVELAAYIRMKCGWLMVPEGQPSSAHCHGAGCSACPRRSSDVLLCLHVRWSLSALA